MQNDFDDEYEEVPSPFQKTSTLRKNLSGHTNLFARPIGVVPSEAPTISAPSRRSVARPEQTDFVTPKRVKAVPQIEYLEKLDDDEFDEETEEEDTLPVKRAPAKPRPKAKARGKVDYLPRVGWAIVLLCMLRLVFMERGVLAYLQMDGQIEAKQQEITRVQRENDDITKEIRRITFDKSYQRQIAKEILGVIAADEFLILFAGESSESPSEADRPL